MSTEFKSIFGNNRLWDQKIAKEAAVSAGISSSIFGSPMPQLPPQPPATVDTPLTPLNLVSRLLGPNHRFIIRTNIEVWDHEIPNVLIISLLDRNTKQIVRFEEDVYSFPSDNLIDKLRLLR